MNTRNPGIANFGITVIQSRHSVRKFRDEEIPPEFVRKALECAARAPTARNHQPWIFVTVKNKETLAKIGEFAPNGKFIEGANIGFLIFSEADWEYAVEDCSAATENLMLALHAYGYGSCWIAGNGKPYSEDIRKLVNVPETYRLISIVAAGEADVGGVSLAEKKTLADLIFEETYK